MALSMVMCLVAQESSTSSSELDGPVSAPIDGSIVDKSNGQLSIGDFFSFPKSQFTNQQDKGTDPFFPHSKRRIKKEEKIEIKGPKNRFDFSNVATSIQLQGINWSKSKPIALINGVTFSEGETRLIKLFGKQSPVRCLKILRTAVLVKFIDHDEYKVLKLREEE